MALDTSAFKKTYVYETRAPVPEVLADLKALAGLDSRAEKTRTLVGIGSWVFVCLSISFTVLTQWLLAAAFFATSIALCIRWMRSKHTDLDNRRYGLVSTLLQRFQVDLDANAPVDVKLDLAPEDEARKSVGKLKRGRWDCEDFTDAWLSLHGRFADGTHLHLSVVEHVQKRKRYGRGSSGKTKLKTKRKGKTLLQVGLRVKPERFPGLAEQRANAKQAVRLPPEVVLSRLDVAQDRVAMRALLGRDGRDWVVRRTKPASPSELIVRPPDDASRVVTMMLLSLYQVLNHSSSQGQPGKMRSTP
ncbi:hypothetical protein D7X99_06740 [Corallococcus sp. AB032C]|uniref:hypothetical protein n=1 Tax=Corallococcus TaxID=83461 RepID=UPI000EE081DC|nr:MULTISPECIES: hypothetical protein [Corallococcus]NPC47920.1 hypothetical protein [Corallococcus exiguus]RKH85396.1 hypothetical protein D7X99_06740 [Corallococcus sp. AB032C]